MPQNAKRIVQYQAYWHPTGNEGVIYAELEGLAGRRRIWVGEDTAEFNAVMLILTTSENPFITANGWISTGSDELGDD